LVLSQVSQRPVVIPRFHQHRPPLVGFIHDGLHALAGQHQAPLHRLPPRAGGDAGKHRFHSQPAAILETTREAATKPNVPVTKLAVP
jgi:hypothetical protein